MLSQCETRFPREEEFGIFPDPLLLGPQHDTLTVSSEALETFQHHSQKFLRSFMHDWQACSAGGGRAFMQVLRLGNLWGVGHVDVSSGGSQQEAKRD